MRSADEIYERLADLHDALEFWQDELTAYLNGDPSKYAANYETYCRHNIEDYELMILQLEWVLESAATTSKAH